MKSFEELGLNSEFLQTIKTLGFEGPTEIQEKTIPLALAGKDIIGESATGSGKTLAFGASIIQNIVPNNTIQALIMAPTRELAEQVSKSLKVFSKHKKILISAIYGGVGIVPQIRELQRADIVVGTPGRILDHLERRTINLKNVKTLVLDEADKMLDMGFIDDVARIIEHCPDQRQTLLFSATISPDIARLAKRYMNHPAEVSAVSYVDASKLEQVYYDSPKHIKFSLLVHLLKQEMGGLVMVFCNTRMNVDFVARHLKENGIESAAIHGGLTQSRRNMIIQHFHSKDVFVLVCTDVAARGLDIPNVSHVYNYDIPTNSKEYVHRIGRTARAGKEGKAINLVADRDYENFRNVLMDSSLKIVKAEVPEVQQIQIRMSNFRDNRGGSRGYGGRGGSRGGSRGGGYRGGRGGSRDGPRDYGRPRSGNRRSSGRSFGRRQF